MDIIVAIFLFLIGIYVLYLAKRSATLTCEKTIEYRYIPRTFAEENSEPIPVSQIFDKMFQNQQPNVAGYVN